MQQTFHVLAYILQNIFEKIKGKKMAELILSMKGQELINQYSLMAKEGYKKTDNALVSKAYNDFELKKFRELVFPYISRTGIKSVLDYGGGGSDWEQEGFDDKTKKSAKDFFLLHKVSTYEPARNLNKKLVSDCVVCMDVLEHIFIQDVPSLLRDLFSHAKSLLIINVACYKAAALLPCGENAHITVRDPLWWKGMIDSISIEFPKVSVLLICSPSYLNFQMFEFWNAQDWSKSKAYTVDLEKPAKGGKPETENQPITLTKNQILDFVERLAKEDPTYIPKLIDVLMKNLASSVS